MLAHAAIDRTLRRIRSGVLVVRETWSGRTTEYGTPAGDLRGELDVHDPAFYSRVLRGRSIGLAEAYADGLWDSPDLVEPLRIAAREVARADRVRGAAARLTGPLRRASGRLLRNTPDGARRNITAHYDLGNELFELFLDREAMAYSSALYTRADATLEEAQREKLDRICRALALGPEVHLLEIGTGWGGLALWAASRYGCRVTTTTISAAQREYAARRIARAGLEDRVSVIGVDYRDLTGRYDRLVSVEMIEAVGAEYTPRFFRCCSELLTDEGLMFLQAICIDDRAYAAERDAPSFANRLIFPGGCLPSPEIIARALARETDMSTVRVEDISRSYVLTLRAWRERFVAAQEEVAGLGYDRRFRRLWELYLAYAEAGFRERRITDLQILCAKPGWRGGVQPGAAPHAATADAPASADARLRGP